MRLLAAGLLIAALLVLPTAAAVTTHLSLSGPNAIVYFTDSTTQSVPITINLQIDSGFFCQAPGTATVALAVTPDGPITASLNVTSVKFTIPADVDPNNPTGATNNHATAAWSGQAPVNLTLVSSGLGNGTAKVTATFDGNTGCQPTPDANNPQGTFDTATGVVNVSTQALTASTGNVTPTPTTPVSSTPVNTTPETSTPVTSTPVSTTVGDENPTPTEASKGKFLGVPGPEIPLVVAAAVALAVLVRRKD